MSTPLPPTCLCQLGADRHDLRKPCCQTHTVLIPVPPVRMASRNRLLALG